MAVLRGRVTTFDVDGVLAKRAGAADPGDTSTTPAQFSSREMPVAPVWEAIAFARSQSREGNSEVAYFARHGVENVVAVTRWLWQFGLPYGEVMAGNSADVSPGGGHLKVHHLLRLRSQFEEVYHYDNDPAVVEDINASGTPGLVAVMAPWQSGSNARNSARRERQLR